MDPTSLRLSPNAESLSTPLETLSVRLKRETKRDHQALEVVPALQHLMGNSLTHAQYSQLMAMWYRCWHPLEEALEGITQRPVASGTSISGWADLLPAPRRFALANDLKALGVPHLDQRNLLDNLPDMSGCGWLSTAYVLKGAQLGNAVIAPHVHRQLGLDPRAPGAGFFRFHRQDESSTMPDWRRWCSKLDGIELSEPQRVLVVQGAQKTFQFLRRHLSVIE